MRPPLIESVYQTWCRLHSQADRDCIVVSVQFLQVKVVVTPCKFAEAHAFGVVFSTTVLEINDHAVCGDVLDGCGITQVEGIVFYMVTDPEDLDFSDSTLFIVGVDFHLLPRCDKEGVGLRVVIYLDDFHDFNISHRFNFACVQKKSGRILSAIPRPMMAREIG
jgi:hypothetical protein